MRLGRRLVTALAFVAMTQGLCSVASPAQQAAMGPACSAAPLRVLTMNIARLAPPVEARMKALRVLVERLQPDIMAFQETTCKGTEEDQVRQALSGLAYTVVTHAPGCSDQDIFLGVSIASRHPIKERRPGVLPNRGSVLGVRIDAPAPYGRLFFASVMPGQWKFDQALQREQAAVALDTWIRGWADPAGFPPVLAGDFDATPEDASIRFLTGLQSLEGRSTHYRDAFAVAGSGSGYTWTTTNGWNRPVTLKYFHLLDHHRRIDYILFGSPHHYKRPLLITGAAVEGGVALDTTWPSDHNGVSATFCAMRNLD